jgi:hypothetical protein
MFINVQETRFLADQVEMPGEIQPWNDARRKQNHRFNELHRRRCGLVMRVVLKFLRWKEFSPWSAPL